MQYYDWWKKFFWSTSKKNDLRIYAGIRKIWTGQGDDYTTACLLGYLYFEKYYELIAIYIDLRYIEQQAFDACPKAIQKVLLET